MTKEFIKFENDDKYEWVCLCGNRGFYHGFFPCDKDGNEVEPLPNWGGLYFCNYCGRIFQEDTREVVGQNLNFKKIT